MSLTPEELEQISTRAAEKVRRAREWASTTRLRSPKPTTARGRKQAWHKGMVTNNQFAQRDPREQ